MSKKVRIPLVIVLVLAGVFFLFYNQITGYAYEKWLNKNQNELITTLTKEKLHENAEKVVKKEDKKEMFDYGAIENIDNGFTMPDINPYKMENAIGIITIPSVNLEQPILYGTTNENLLMGATTMKPKQKMGEGNYALAGHNHNTRPVLFQPIRNVKMGDDIYVTDKKKVYHYTVSNKQIVQPERVDVIDDVKGQKLVTLVSCYAKDGSNRIIVTGKLKDVIDFKE